MPTNDEQIYFIVTEPVIEEFIPVEGERSSNDMGGGWDNQPRRSRVDAIARSVQQQRVGIRASALKAQMQSLIGVVNEIFAQNSQSLSSQPDSSLELAEITLSVQVNAKGELSILGTGGELGGSGGIAMKFVRPKP